MAKKTNADSLIDKLNEELGVIEEPKKAAKPKDEIKKKTEKSLEVKAKESKKEVKAEEKKLEGTVKRSQKYQQAAEKIEKNRLYPLEEAVNLAKEVSYTKFPATLEVHINTAIKNVRGFTTLPFAAGKAMKVIAFGKGAAESGADMVGDEAALEEIKKGRIGFDVLVTTAEWMPRIVPLAKVLGPKGLMPNPKNGTVTDNLAKAVAELQGGKTEYKTEKDRMTMHMAIGKITQPNEEIIANIKTLYGAMGKSKVKKLVISPTMGLGVKVNLNSI